MELEIQIQSLALSFFYGLFISLIFNLLYFLFFHENKLIKITLTFIFIFLIISLYFYLLFIINGGIVNFYFIIFSIIGFYIGNLKVRRIRITKKTFNH